MKGACQSRAPFHLRSALRPPKFHRVSELKSKDPQHTQAPEPARVTATMRFDSPSKFLEFYDKQLSRGVVGLRHADTVEPGTEVLLTLLAPGSRVPLSITGSTESATRRADGSARLRVGLKLDAWTTGWIEAFVTGLRVGLEAAVEAASDNSEHGGSVVPRDDPRDTDDLSSRVSNMDTQTYFQILNVAKDILPEALQKRFHELTRLYHPELYSAEDSQSISRDVGRLYRRMNEAYAVLKDPRRRKSYEQGLAGPPHTWSLRLTEEAEQAAQRGRQFRRGDTPLGHLYWTLARDVLERARTADTGIRIAMKESSSLLRIALALEPDNEHFRHALEHVLYRLSVADDA